MNALDYLNYQHDMQESYEADYELWVWFQECEYWYLTLILLITECPHLLDTLIHEAETDWMVF